MLNRRGDYVVLVPIRFEAGLNCSVVALGSTRCEDNLLRECANQAGNLSSSGLNKCLEF
jgi:hypothetical protein